MVGVVAAVLADEVGVVVLLTDLSTIETACSLMQLFTTFHIAIELKTCVEYVECSSVTSITCSGRSNTGFEDFAEVFLVAITAIEAYVSLGFG
jgi:hypothetical protein